MERKKMVLNEVGHTVLLDSTAEPEYDFFNMKTNAVGNVPFKHCFKVKTNAQINSSHLIFSLQ